MWALEPRSSNASKGNLNHLAISRSQTSPRRGGCFIPMGDFFRPGIGDPPEAELCGVGVGSFG